MSKSMIYRIGRGGLAALAVAAMVAITFSPSNSLGGITYAQSTDVDSGNLAALESLQNSFRAVADKVLPTVVEVNTVDIVSQASSGSGWPFFRQPSQPQQREFRRNGLGSGVIVGRDNDRVYVLTNNHVAAEAEEISITLYDKREFDAELVGTDARRDLALLVFSTKEDVPVAELGNSDGLYVGDWVLAVGNPLGFESTITAGIVSAKGRRPMAGADQAGFTDFIQTDAAVNQGNSGGALVNIRGEVVGINSWIASPSGGNIGLGFAIPINVAKRTIAELVAAGEVEYGWLGVTIGDPSAEVALDLGLERVSGGFVYSVFEDSPAERAGLLPGDYITVIDGQAIEDSNHATYIIGNLRPGDEAHFEVVRYGSPLVLDVKMARRAEGPAGRSPAGKLWPGLAVTKLTDELRAQIGVARGEGEVVVVAVDANSPAASAGLRPGDIIEKVDDKRISSVLEFYRTINDGDSDLRLNVFRQGTDVLLRLAA